MVANYSRPLFVERDYVDEHGRPVRYGRRRDESRGIGPQPDGVNTFSNQERYEPISAVADALIAYLTAAYDVVIDDDNRHASAFEITMDAATTEFARVVRVLPSGADQATLFIGFLNAPGSLRILAGDFSEFDMWFCGCDACDETWEDIADSLEEVVLAIASRGTAERVDRRWRGSARYWLDPANPTKWAGTIGKRGMRPHVLATAEESARHRENGRWVSWTPRKAE